MSNIKNSDPGHAAEAPVPPSPPPTTGGPAGGEHEVRSSGVFIPEWGPPQLSVPDKSLADGGHWVEREYVQCSSCGSLHPAEVIKLVQTNGTKFSTKYHSAGWMIVFYLEPAGSGRTYEFFAAHLADASPVEFAVLTSIMSRLFNITVIRTGNHFQFITPAATLRRGTVWGEIVDGEPDFSAMRLVNGRQK